MPFRKVKFKKSLPYHVFNSGINSKNIFLDEFDFERFVQSIFLSNNFNSFRGVSKIEKNRHLFSLEDIGKILKEKNIVIEPLVEIHSYCLMPNHFHFLLTEKRSGGISLFFQKLCNSYGKYFCKKYQYKGSVFAGRFKTIEIRNKEDLKLLFSYINVINPGQIAEPYLKIKGVENFPAVWESIEKYKWSSGPNFLKQTNSMILNKKVFLKLFLNIKDYTFFSKSLLSGERSNFWKSKEHLFFE